MENKFRAVRYGLDGKLIDFGRQQELPLRDLLEEYLALIDPVVDELGSREAINGVRKIMRTGTGADRQLKVFEESKGDLKAVVDYMAKETAEGLEFKPGALSAVTTCLRIDPTEKVTLITDRATEPIAAALGAQLAERGCPWNVFVLEDLASRPLIDMPAAVLADMESSQVSIFAVQVQPNELHSRMQMTDVVNRRHMRHAHMVNITPEIMCQGMRADFNLVDRLSQKVLDRVRKATRIRATTAAGTDITAEMNPGV
jgi:hypothetical protein